MPRKIMEEDLIELDRELLVEVSKPLFYGYIFLAGIGLLGYPMKHTGTLLGISGLAAITFVSAALARGVNGEWKSFIDLISITSLLMAILFGCYVATSISFGL